MVVITAKIEEELADLGKEEAEEYLKELGIEDSGINRMIKSVYNLLKLRTFITAGEKKFELGLSPQELKLHKLQG